MMRTSSAGGPAHERLSDKTRASGEPLLRRVPPERLMLAGLTTPRCQDAISNGAMTSEHTGWLVQWAPLTTKSGAENSSSDPATMSLRLVVMESVTKASLPPSCSTISPPPSPLRRCTQPIPAQASSPGVVVRCSAYTQYKRSPQVPTGGG